MGKRYYLAIDIGAASDCHIVGWRENGEIKPEEVYRFPNGVQEADGHLVGDMKRLLAEVKTGITAAKEKYPKIKSLSTDAKLLVELDNGKNSFGLIERVRQGQGRPTKIYVKRFTTRAVPAPPPEPSPRPRLFSGQECGEVAAKTAEKPHQVILNQIKLISAILIHLSFHQVPRRVRDGWIDWISGEKWMRLLAMRACAASTTGRTWTR